MNYKYKNVTVTYVNQTEEVFERVALVTVTEKVVQLTMWQRSKVINIDTIKDVDAVETDEEINVDEWNTPPVAPAGRMQ